MEELMCSEPIIGCRSPPITWHGIYELDERTWGPHCHLSVVLLDPIIAFFLSHSLDGNPRVLTICLSGAMLNDFVVLHKLQSFLRQIDQFGPKTKTKKKQKKTRK